MPPPSGGEDLATTAAADLALPPGDVDLAAPPDLGTAAADLATARDLSPPADLACAPIAGAHRVFVTATTTTGNIAASGNATSGLDGADKLCAASATAAGLGGAWKAWLSTSQVNAIDRLADAGPWYLVDRCTLVFGGKAAIVAGGPAAAIDRLADGSQAPPVNLWTGTKKTGVKDDFTCNDWTNDQPIHGYEGTVGTGDDTFFAGAWTDTATNPCRLSAALVCFEQ